jgi:hypothetical protein
VRIAQTHRREPLNLAIRGQVPVGEGGELAAACPYREVSHLNGGADGADAARVLIDELLRTALALGGVLSSLLGELPDGAFQGEDNGAVLVEMLVGSCLPAVEAAGEPDCWAASALIGAVRDRVLEDLRAAAALAGPDR